MHIPFPPLPATLPPPQSHLSSPLPHPFHSFTLKHTLTQAPQGLLQARRRQPPLVDGAWERPGSTLTAAENGGERHDTVHDMGRGRMAHIALFGKGEGDGDAAIGVVSSPCRGAIEALILVEQEAAMQEGTMGEGTMGADETAAAAVPVLAGTEAFVSPGVGCMIEVEDKEACAKRTHLAPPAVSGDGQCAEAGRGAQCGEAGRGTLPVARFVDVSLSSLDATLASLARGARAHPIERRLGELQRCLFTLISFFFN